ncbi:MAG: cobalamin-dependent protein [Deltaproteobacteria bacterium]|nr:cobalamin-dependent protein [Deltaproteobacteria bacterium]
MKILLVYPYCLEDRLHAEDISVPPMGLYYVGAVLKENGFDVEILNWHNINKTPEKIKETLVAKNPDVIGFSILHANRWGGIEIARIARQIDCNVRIVFGGIGATFLWKHLLTHFKEIDFVVMGEGEYTFLNLVGRIENEDLKDIEDVKGIAFRKNGKVIKTKDAPVIRDLDRLPNPAKYFEYQHISATRGCPGNCTFCGSPQFWGHKVRFHSPDNFVDQLEHLYKKGITFFYFSDDTFTIKKDRVIDICRKIIERNLKISWAAISRVNYVSQDMLYWMRKAGCTQISYGVESGSEKIRNAVLKKNIKAGQIRNAFALTTKQGIMARAYFIYGSPGENWDTVQETIDLIHEIKPLSIIFYILDIFPGTALYSDFKRKVKVTDDIWLKQVEDIMYFETDPHLTRELILAFGEKLRTTFYENLPGFIDAIELINKKELNEMHSDFLSRLGMTFTHGDYAQVETIKEKEKIAERLYERSLDYHPDHRAYLGLGIIRQKNGEYEGSVRLLWEGIKYFPHSEPLNLCLGISYMNLGEYDKALPYFLKFQDSKDAVYHIAGCYRALGDFEKESDFVKKFQSF